MKLAVHESSRTYAASRLGLPAVIAISSIASSLSILLAFVITIRSIVSILVRGVTSGEVYPLSRFIDTLVSSITLMLQLYILYDSIRFIPEEPLYVLTALAITSAVAVIVYELIKYLRMHNLPEDVVAKRC